MDGQTVIAILTALGVGAVLQTLVAAFVNRKTDAVDVTAKLQGVWIKQIEEMEKDNAELRAEVAQLRQEVAALTAELAVYRHNQGA